MRVLEPDDVFARVAGNEEVEIAVFVHVDEARVVAALIAADDVFGETAFAVVEVKRIPLAGSDGPLTR